MKEDKRKEAQRRRRLADSRDEMNLTEIPFATLSSRAPPGVNVLERQWEGFDNRLKQTVLRKVTVVGDGRFGLPTPRDEEVYHGLLHAAKEYNDLREQRVFFSRGELLSTIAWKKNNAAYRRLSLAMDKLAGTRLICENVWRDNAIRETRVRENLSILDSYKFRDSRCSGKNFKESSSEFVWGRVLFESFCAGYVKRLNLDTIFKLTPLARRLARLLDKIAYPEKGKRQFDFDVRELVCERMGGTHRDLSHIITRLLMPACLELEKIGLIRKEPKSTRVTDAGRGRAEVHFEVVGSLSRKYGKHASCRTNGKAKALARPEHRIFQNGQFVDRA